MDQDQNEIILVKKFRLIEKIGSGSFGSIYKCQNLQDKKYYAVKLQKKGKGQGQLQYQIKLYQIFQGINGIPQLYDYGAQNQKLFMVIDLLSHSLQDLFQLCNKKFSISTIISIGLQIISRLQQIHRKGFVHRDIKGNNFMIGRKKKKKIVYIIDFGLAKRFKDLKTGSHIQMKGGKSLVGTARYASIASHTGYQQCRRDDLQSLGYLLLYFLRGRLPWQGIQLQSKVQKYHQIGKMKMQADIPALCTQLNKRGIFLAKYFQIVKNIKFQQQPNYDLLKKLLKKDLIHHQEQNNILDWQDKLGSSQQKKKLSDKH